MSSLDTEYIAKLKFDSSHLSMLRQIGEYRGKQELYHRRSPAALESLRQHAVIESVESSNRLEQIVAPRPRIVGLVREKTVPQNRSEQEIAGYIDALQLIHNSFAQIDINTESILQIHKAVYKYHHDEGGFFKNKNNEIVELDAKGSVARVRFKPVQAAQTPSAMRELCSRYHDLSSTADMLLVLPLMILDFLCVHPFKDGNGRVARLLTLLILHQHDYGVGRYVSLERVFEQQKEGYYRSLEQSSQGWHAGKHDPFPWLNYFWAVMLAAYREFSAKLKTLRHAGRASKTAQVRLVVAAKETPFTISSIVADCPEVSHAMIRNVLRQLRDEGIIISTGKGRTAKWIKKNPLQKF